MKQQEYLSRVYRTDPDTGSYLIDVKLEKYLYAFNEWDSSYFMRRDMDEDLVNFLLNCADDIPPRERIAIVFAVDESPNPQMETLLRDSMASYFRNKLWWEQRDLRQIYKRAVWYTIGGLLVLLAAAAGEPVLPDNVIGRVVTEGLFIGGWVLFWEALAMVTFQRPALRRFLRQLKRLSTTEIRFDYHTNIDAFEASEP